MTYEFVQVNNSTQLIHLCFTFESISNDHVEIRPSVVQELSLVVFRIPIFHLLSRCSEKFWLFSLY